MKIFLHAITSIALAVDALGSSADQSAIERHLESPSDPVRFVFGDASPNVDHLLTYNGLDGAGLPQVNSSLLPGVKFETTSSAFGDFNGDGKLDLVRLDQRGTKSGILLNDGNDQFPGPAIILQLPSSGVIKFHGATTVDVDKDGYDDVVVKGKSQSEGIWIYKNNAGTFGAPMQIGGGVGTYGKSLVVVDLNGDSWPDLLVSNGGYPGGDSISPAKIFYNDGAGNYPTSVDLEATDDPVKTSSRMLTGDVDGDGHIDIVVTTASTVISNRLFINSGNGSFIPQDVPTEAFTCKDGGLVDMNGDGWLDIVFGYYSFPTDNDHHQLLLNDGSGNFPTSTQIPSHKYTDRLNFADVDGDGDVDILECADDSGGWLSLNDGSGVFTPPHKIIQVNACADRIAVLGGGFSPTPNPALTPGWGVGFDSFSANFSATSQEEMTIKYKVGKGRAYETFLYHKDCTTIVTNATIVHTLSHYPMDYNETYNLLMLEYSFDKSGIANSTVWNSNTSQIELCQRVNLFENTTIGKLVIAEDVRTIDVAFDLSVDFNFTNDLAAGTVGSEAKSTNVDSYVNAFKCSEGSFVKDDTPLTPNNVLYICIVSTSPDVNVDALQSMKISQTKSDGSTANLEVVTGSNAVFAAITSISYVSGENGVAVATRVPMNVFQYLTGGKISITGGIAMKLANGTSVGGPAGTRKLRSLVGAKPNAASYELKIDLEGDMANVFVSNSAAIVSKMLAFATAVNAILLAN